MYFKTVRKSLQKVLPEIVTVLDIGASKVCCYIGRLGSGDTIQVMGVGYEASKGIRNGAIVNMEALSTSVARATHAAEQMAQVTVNDVLVSLSAALVESHILDVSLPIAGRAVDDNDIRKMQQTAAQSVGGSNSEILHCIPVTFNIDGTRGVKDPRGMVGESLGASIHVITAETGPVRNFYACVDRCHLSVSGFVVAPYASSLSTLVEDEIDLGVTLIDMGAGSTSISVFYDGRLYHTDYLPVGGLHVTNDIARGLSTPLLHAERIKILHGSAMVSPLSNQDDRGIISVPQIGEDDPQKGLQVTKSELVRIIRPRIEETFELVKERLKKFNDVAIASKRLVLTGGASQLPGVRELASLILDKHTRLGKPINVQGLDERMRTASFATCAGLLIYARGEQKLNASRQKKMSQNAPAFFGRFGVWLRENL